MSAGGAKVADVLKERGLARGRIGLVGFGPTAPGEAEGLLPLGFHTNLVKALPEATIGDFTLAFTDFMLVKSARGDRAAALRRPGERGGLPGDDGGRRGRASARRWSMPRRCARSIAGAATCAIPFFSLQSGQRQHRLGRAALEPARRAAAHPRDRRPRAGRDPHDLWRRQEGQVNMSVALDPVDDVVRRLEDVARESYEAGLAAVRPGVTFASVVQAMEKPLARRRLLEQDAAAAHAHLRLDRLHRRSTASSWPARARRRSRARPGPASAAATSCSRKA